MYRATERTIYRENERTKEEKIGKEGKGKLSYVSISVDACLHTCVRRCVHYKRYWRIYIYALYETRRK